MEKNKLKRRVAEVAYNVIFGAKRHFSSYDIAEKFPVFFGLITAIAGIYFLAYKSNYSDAVSFILIAIGLGVSYLSFYSTEDKKNFVKVGRDLTEKYNRLRSIHEKIDGANSNELIALEQELNLINKEFHETSIYKQVFGSDIYAHYKLFGESQPKWLEDELSLTFCKDKIPFSIKFFIFILILILFLCLICNWPLVKKFTYCLGA